TGRETNPTRGRSATKRTQFRTLAALPRRPNPRCNPAKRTQLDEKLERMHQQNGQKRASDGEVTRPTERTRPNFGSSVDPDPHCETNPTSACHVGMISERES